MIVETKSVEETMSLGRKIGATLKAGDVVTLSGDLGSGKTTLTKGIAQALGITQTITSPTFTLIQIHELKKKTQAGQFAHIDTYRTKSAEECIGAGITDILFNEKTICVVEWPNKIKKLLTKETINIKLNTKNNKHEINVPDHILKFPIRKKIPIAYWLFLIIMIGFYLALFKAVQ
ncbi:MAG: tRNA (adenosine(37)-N6)-threonylcarbamoyltransferase complex ATPase subunit type 1 TsaE [Parcubacteria group bacterium]|nr:tRNA (adenosine(37)-N6)-threonylcarbamoyltransferase complex ATPase subunit type 1 TsaE [Parcubacteria group bacterium]|tara:strand:+ start:197 stop:724 length:528 start_codon:yes stop_codon:yes gene_type:complete